MSATRKIAFTIAAPCLVVAVAAGLYFCYLFYTVAVVTMPSAPKAGPFNRAHMENLVAQVRSQRFDGQKRFWWTGLSGTGGIITDPGPWNAGVPRPLSIAAERGPDQALKLVIETVEWGRGGSAGFAYSDVPLELTPDLGNAEHDGLLRLDVPSAVRNSRPEMKIDAHWWEVFQEGD